MGKPYGLISMMAMGVAGLLGSPGFGVLSPTALTDALPELRRRRGKNRSTGHKHGHCKRGGKSKRSRNLNYWRR